MGTICKKISWHPELSHLIHYYLYTDQKGNNGSPKVVEQVAYKPDEGKTELPEKNWRYPQGSID